MKTPLTHSPLRRWNSNHLLPCLLALTFFGGLITPVMKVSAAPSQEKLAQSEVTAFDLLMAMNTLRVSNGLPALVEDPIIDAVAQSTAQIMAANQMSWHIGDVSGRVQSAGYGGGSKVWATENFAVGSSFTIDKILAAWADPSHMIPAVNPAYCHMGAGVAQSSNGMTYYVFQAAYTAGKSCGDYIPPQGATIVPGGSTDAGRAGGVSQLIVPVKIASPDADGRLYHVVEAGQSYWSIAVAYKITIADLETWNNLSRNDRLQIGQKLFIPGPNTQGYATPTPVGMFQVNTPDADGKIIHTVQPYQSLSTISTAYHVPVETILAINGIQIDWPLQIGQKLMIHPGNVTPSPTARPLTPVEKLTPASDGNFYHIVQSGESLAWIADLYKVKLNELMGWNALNTSSILQPNQKLLLQVTPPATITPTFAPATVTPTAPPATPSPTHTSSPTAVSSPASAATATAPVKPGGNSSFLWFLLLGLGAGGFLLFSFFSRKK